jgi:tRNA pseudouridine38-40 synthase
MHYKCIIAYDGTDYAGWQIQPDRVGIAQVLQKAFHEAFAHTITLKGASRTDAGVHALGQVAFFATDLNISAETMQKAWNGRLPAEIIIRSISLATAEQYFHRKRSQKTYWYHFFNQRPLPFVARYGYYHRFSVDIEKLKKALRIFVGTHDFRSFYTGYEKKNTVRHIDSISLFHFKRLNVYRIEVKGSGFLRFMIRRIVGACLQVASDPSKSISLLEKVLAEKNPQQTLFNAPAHGLLLYKITYHHEV